MQNTAVVLFRCWIFTCFSPQGLCRWGRLRAPLSGHVASEREDGRVLSRCPGAAPAQHRGGAQCPPAPHGAGWRKWAAAGFVLVTQR